jgi:hypothetical protein
MIEASASSADHPRADDPYLAIEHTVAQIGTAFSARSRKRSRLSPVSQRERRRSEGCSEGEAAARGTRPWKDAVQLSMCTGTSSTSGR